MVPVLKGLRFSNFHARSAFLDAIWRGKSSERERPWLGDTWVERTSDFARSAHYMLAFVGWASRRQAPSTSEPEAVAGADCVQSTFLFRSPPFQKGLYLNIFPFFAPARLQLEEEVLKKVEGHQKKIVKLWQSTMRTTQLTGPPNFCQAFPSANFGMKCGCLQFPIGQCKHCHWHCVGYNVGKGEDFESNWVFIKQISMRHVSRGMWVFHEFVADEQGRKKNEAIILLLFLLLWTNHHKNWKPYYCWVINIFASFLVRSAVRSAHHLCESMGEKDRNRKYWIDLWC